MDKVRFGIVGTGGIGHHHLRYIGQVKGAELTCLCDIREDVVAKVSREHGVPCFVDSKELVRSGLCDAILIGTPHYQHATVGIDALENGLHVLTEKPITVQVSQADRMVAAAKKNKVRLGVMFQRRAEPMWKKAKAIIDSGALGRLLRTCMIEPHYRTQAYYDSGDWRATWVGEGGGVMMNQAPHSLDCFVWLGGVPKTVYGKTETRGHKIEVEDQAVAMLTYENGATGYLYTSTFEYPGMTLFQFVGDRAVLEIRDGQLRLGTSAPGSGEFIRTTPEAWAVPVSAWTDISTQSLPYGPAHRHVTENFVAAVLDGVPLLAPGEEAVKSLELANAITVSSEKKKEVTMPLNRKSFDDVLRKYIARSKDKKGKTGKVVLPWI